MKKILICLLALLLCAGLTACNKPVAPAETSSEGTQWGTLPKDGEKTSYGTTVVDGKSSDAAGEYDLSFVRSVTLNGVEIALHADAAPVVAALGESTSYYESNSCAFTGLDKTYTYPGFVLMTYPDGETDRVSKVVLTDDSVKTGDGLYIGMAVQGLLDKLGGGYTEEAGGSYSYATKEARVLILANCGIVTSLQYIANND